MTRALGVPLFLLVGIVLAFGWGISLTSNDRGSVGSDEITGSLPVPDAAIFPSPQIPIGKPPTPASREVGRSAGSCNDSVKQRSDEITGLFSVPDAAIFPSPQIAIERPPTPACSEVGLSAGSCNDSARQRSDEITGSSSLLDATILPSPQIAIGKPPTPACSDLGLSAGSCVRREVEAFKLFSTHPSHRGTATVEEVMEKGLKLVGASPVHLAFRGTALEGSVRCHWRGVARTLDQREAAIRHWLGIDKRDPLPSPSKVEAQFMSHVNQMYPLLSDSMEANFKALARGGASTDWVFLTCFADFTVDEYPLGPTIAVTETLTVAYDRLGEARSFDLYRRSHENGRFGAGPMKTEGEYQETLAQKIRDVESRLNGIVESHESVVFLPPMAAHQTIATEAWQAVAQWDLQTAEDNPVSVVRFGSVEGDPEHTQTLTILQARIAAAAASDAFAEQRIANVSGLTQEYRNIGAYDDITPGDGDTSTFTPAQPPRVPTCAYGAAVSSPADNRDLVHDCGVLLDSKVTLAGSASLEWSLGTTISGWEGISTSAPPSRVTGLALPSRSLTGRIPDELGTLFELKTLDLSSNQLTGEIPHEIGWLSNLEEIRLSGNSLTGCIPIALETVASNDLELLNLLYCAPPPPGNLNIGTSTENSISLGWDAVSNTNNYRLESRIYGISEWTIEADMLIGTSDVVDELLCESTYQFRVSAYGSGATYTEVWSEPSAVASQDTGTCESRGSSAPKSPGQK